jgi:hypothetical protein
MKEFDRLQESRREKNGTPSGREADVHWRTVGDR